LEGGNKGSEYLTVAGEEVEEDHAIRSAVKRGHFSTAP